MAKELRVTSVLTVADQSDAWKEGEREGGREGELLDLDAAIEGGREGGKDEGVEKRRHAQFITGCVSRSKYLGGNN